MKFKVGDKVKVRSDLEVGETYNGLCYVEPMQKYKGKTLTISGIDDDNRWYFAEEDGEEWCWTDDMLELNVVLSMTAMEVLGWLKDNQYTGVCEEIFNAHNAGYVIDTWSPKEIIDKIAAYEATKKASKPVKVEWINLCRIIQTKDDGTKEVVYEENLKAETPFDTDPDLKEQTEAILKKYTLGHDGRYIAVIEEVCRVKEGES